MPIPRNWSEELVCEWLNLQGYLTEVDIPIPLGTGGQGGRKEVDVVGVKISKTDEMAPILQICHVEVGQLPEPARGVDRLKEKFSTTRINEIVKRYKERLAFDGEVHYDKVYIDIWERSWAEKLMSDPAIAREGIKVWAPSKFYPEVLETIRAWKKSTGDSTLPESYWMLKMLASLQDAKLL